MKSKQLRLGLVINPVAGIGGSVALKGSDGAAIQALAKVRGAQAKAHERTATFLDVLYNNSAVDALDIQWTTYPGVMGGNVLRAANIPFTELPQTHIDTGTTSAQDTQRIVAALIDTNIDLLVFVGGDGTARDVMSVVQDEFPVLGIPAGVKMHSGVFAVSPRTAAHLIQLLATGGLVASSLREVRDYQTPSQDKLLADQESIQVTHYGEMRVPEVAGYLQQTKVGGKESEPLVLQELCAYLVDTLPRDRPLVIGPGSTCLAIKAAFGCEGTLRGCDIIYPEGRIEWDATAQDLERLVRPLLVVSFTREQGFLFGRGNQQISAQFLAKLNWPEDAYIVGSRTKILSLQQRPLLLDTSDTKLDDALTGLIQVITGYDDHLLYRLSGSADNKAQEHP